MFSLGKNQSILTTMGTRQLVQHNYSPLTLTLVAQKSANTGVLLDVAQSLEGVLQQVGRSVSA